MTSKLLKWRRRGRDSDARWEDSPVAYWEVMGDPISDDYTPDEITAAELLDMWAKRYSEKYTDGLVPIWWSVRGTKTAVAESMPFAYTPWELPEHFLTHYTWPKEAATGRPLNWLSLPVVDKRWNKKHADKGGFIQEATGWKPSILQPFVYLPSLLNATGP